MTENKHEEKSHYANVRIFMGKLVASSISTLKQNRRFSSPSYIKQSEMNFYISIVLLLQQQLLLLQLLYYSY